MDRSFGSPFWNCGRNSDDRCTDRIFRNGFPVFCHCFTDEKLPEQGEELLPEPFPGGNIPGILPEVPAVPAPATDVSQVVEEAMPAVVAVASTAVYQMPDFGFGWFFGGGSPVL